MSLKKSTGIVIAILLCLLPAVIWAQASYPDELAAVVEQMPGTLVMASAKNSEEVNAILIKKDMPAAEIMDYYKKELTGDGWKVETEMEMGPTKTMEFSKDKKGLIVSLMSEAGGKKAMITLALSNKE